MSTKEYIIKSLIALIGLGLIAYVVRLFMNNAQVMQAGRESGNTFALIFAWLIGLFLVAVVIWEMILPNNRRGVLLLWIWIIWSAHSYLTDTPEQMFYLQDIMKLVWVMLCIAWPTKALQSSEYEEKKMEEEIEVIEV